MSRTFTSAAIFVLLLIHHGSAQIASTEATDCKVQEDSNMLVCTALGAQYSVIGDVDSPVDLSNPPTSYSTCEALDPDGDTLECVGIVNGAPETVTLARLDTSGGSSSVSTTSGSSTSTAMSATGASTSIMTAMGTPSATPASITSAVGNAGIALSVDSSSWTVMAMLGAIAAKL